jgi:aryl-alcohol dehydrogenase-like predicted oxidoreductase
VYVHSHSTLEDIQQAIDHSLNYLKVEWIDVVILEAVSSDCSLSQFLFLWKGLIQQEQVLAFGIGIPNQEDRIKDLLDNAKRCSIIQGSPETIHPWVSMEYPHIKAQVSAPFNGSF